MPFLLQVIPSKLTLSCLRNHFPGFNFKPAFLHRLIISHMLRRSLILNLCILENHSVAILEGLVDAGLKNGLGRF